MIHRTLPFAFLTSSYLADTLLYVFKVLLKFLHCEKPDPGFWEQNQDRWDFLERDETHHYSWVEQDGFEILGRRIYIPQLMSLGVFGLALLYWA